MAIDWNKIIVVRNQDSVNVLAGRKILYVSTSDGRGIVEILKTGTEDNVDTYTIYYTDNTTSTFTITNGSAGRGIADIQKSGIVDNVDTYTIYYTDGTTSTFTFPITFRANRSYSSTGASLKLSADTTLNATILRCTPRQSGSGTPSESNRRPINKHNGLRIYVYEYDEDVTYGDVLDSYTLTFDEQWGEEYYGFEYNSYSGTLYKTWEHIYVYNGETLPGRWMSDRDVYRKGATPTIGAEVVYEVENPIGRYVGGHQFPSQYNVDYIIDGHSSQNNGMQSYDTVITQVETTLPIKDYLDGFLAPAFDPTKVYDVGDCVVYSGGFFRFTEAHYGPWDGGYDTVQTTLYEEMLRRLSS